VREKVAIIVEEMVGHLHKLLKYRINIGLVLQVKN